MSTAQIVFSIALAVVAAIIVAFSIFVVSSAVWGNRWVRTKVQPPTTPSSSIEGESKAV